MVRSKPAKPMADSAPEALLDGVSQAVLLVRKGRVLWGNRAAVALFDAIPDDGLAGVPLEELLGAEFVAALEHKGEMREPFPRACAGATRGGRPLALEATVQAVRWKGGPAVQVALEAAAHDEAEARHRANEQKYRDVVEGSVQGILVHRHGRPLFANQAFANQFGFESAEQVYAWGNMDALIAEEDRARMQGYVRARLAGKPAPSRYVYRGLRVDGRKVWVENLVRVVDWEGEPALQVATVDVTDRVQAEQALRESERLMRMVLDRLPHLVFVKGPERNYRFVNRSFAEFHGLKPEEVLHQRVEALPVSLAEDRDTFLRTDEQVLATGRPVELPVVPLTPVGGTQHLFRLQKLPLFDESGRVTGILGIAEDITERTRAEEELQRSRKLLQSVFDLIPMWVFVKDAQRRFLMINRQMAADYALAGPLNPSERLDLGATITEEERQAVYELDARVLRDGHTIEVPELSITLPEKGPRLFRSARMPLRDADGNVSGIVGFMEDITERRRTEQVLQQAQKLESLGVLAGGIAHDFNNLLVTILGNAGLALLDLPQGSTAIRPLENVERAGQRAAELCRQLLAYAGQGSFEVAQTDLNALIEEMTELLRISLSRGIEMEYQFDRDLPLMEMDSTQVRQVVMNLVMNAAEAIGDAGGRVTITTRRVYAGREQLQQFIQGDQLVPGQFVMLEVADTGPGIDEGTLGRIFDPFFTTKFTGRGLGLAAVLGIVRGHGGAMRVISTERRGAVFRILLPLTLRTAEPSAETAGPSAGPTA